MIYEIDELFTTSKELAREKMTKSTVKRMKGTHERFQLLSKHH